MQAVWLTKNDVIYCVSDYIYLHYIATFLTCVSAGRTKPIADKRPVPAGVSTAIVGGHKK
jgi:hypothetical protein